MSFITKILMISGAYFLVKCSSLPKAPREADFNVAQKKWTDIKMEDLIPM